MAVRPRAVTPVHNPGEWPVILLYCAQSEVNEYAEFVKRLRAGGQMAAVRSVRHYHGEVERKVNATDVTRVLYTDWAPQVRKPYEAAGIPTECVSTLPDPQPDLTDLDDFGDDEEEAPTLPPGYTVAQDGRWWKAFGPTGLKVGKAHQGPDAEELVTQEAWRHYEDPDPWHTAQIEGTDSSSKRAAQGMEG